MSEIYNSIKRMDLLKFVQIILCAISSGIFFVVLSCEQTSYEMWLMTCFVVVMSIIILYRVSFCYKISLASFTMALMTTLYVMNMYKYNIEWMQHRVAKLTGIGTEMVYIVLFFIILFFAVGVYGIFFDYISKDIINEIKNRIGKEDKIYLLFVSLIGIYSLIVIYSKTTAFYAPYCCDGRSIVWDVVFTSDTSEVFQENSFAWFNAPANDIRQPLFGVFAHSFGVFADTVSRLSEQSILYPLLVQGIQIILLALANMLVAIMMDVKKIDKIIFYFLITSCYPMLLFGLNIEQYIFTYFWLIIFAFSNWINCENKGLYFIAATGSLLTSGSLVYLLYDKKRSIWENIKAIFETGVCFIYLLVLFGQVGVVKTAISQIIDLSRFAGTKLTITERIEQFSYFIRSCYICPPIRKEYWDYAIYWQKDVETVSVIGCVILLSVIINLIVIKNKPFILKLSMFWIAFSCILFCFVGWGTAENGLCLYTLYFAWAYIVNLFFFLKQIITNERIRKIAVLVLSFTFFVYNISKIMDMIYYFIEYYPVS